VKALRFRAICEECGQRQPRATTAFTVERWMRQHSWEAHGIDDRPDFIQQKYPREGAAK
jgi:hypothetical protein